MESLVLGLPLSLIVALVPLFPLGGALLNGMIALFCRSGKRSIPTPLVSLVGLLFPLLSFALMLLLFSIAGSPPEGITTRPLWDWISIGQLTVPVAFKVDRLSLVMGLVVTGVGSLIHLYSIGYMRGDAGYARYFSYLNLFLFAMLVLVLASSLPLLFIDWEGVGLCSYLLIGFWFTDEAKAAAGMKAFVVNRIGDLGFLLGMFVLFSALVSRGVDPTGGLLSFDRLNEFRGDLQGCATLAGLLLFIGAIGKSAQIPLYVWLPDAMAGPTPVSALIHAATMVTAGVYLIARMHFLYTLSPVAMEVIAIVGASTALFAATIGLVQRDIKKILAYSTISQLGTMFLAVGVGAFSSGIFHLMTHAFFKAGLFLGAGSVIHALSGEQDIWKMGGLRKKMPATFLTFLLAILAIVGVFPFAGFFSKDAILFHTYATGHRLLWFTGFLGAGLTSFYMCRLFALTFLGTPRLDPEKKYHLHESPVMMTLPLMMLGLLSLIGGWISIPTVFHGGDHFFRWLAPLFPYTEFYEKVEQAGHGIELLLSGGTLFWVLHVGLFVTLFYTQKLGLVGRATEKIRAVHRLLERRYYVDELYDRVLIRPIRWVSEIVCWKFHDEKVIDGLAVHGTAETVGLFGRTLTLFQTGMVQNYALFFVVGALGVILYFVL